MNFLQLVQRVDQSAGLVLELLNHRRGEFKREFLQACRGDNWHHVLGSTLVKGPDVTSGPHIQKTNIFNTLQECEPSGSVAHSITQIFGPAM